MPAPSNLEVATKSVQRLVKEEGYYRVEQSKGQKRVTDLKADIEKGGDGLDPNAEFVLKQETRAVEETKAIFAPLKQRTEDAVAKLEEQVALAESAGSATDQELARAREALKQGKDAVAKEVDT